MNSYHFIFEVEPQLENPLIAHVSRAAVHIWVLSTDMQEARDTAIRFLASDRWEATKEKDAYVATQEQVDGLGAAESSSYQTALSEGIHATFYYWHRSE